MHQFPHFCQDGHEKIGFGNGPAEVAESCPVCLRIDELAQAKIDLNRYDEIMQKAVRVNRHMEEQLALAQKEIERIRDMNKTGLAMLVSAERDRALQENGWLRAALKQLLQRIDSIGKEADRFPDARDRAAILMAQSILAKTPSAPVPPAPAP